MSLLRLHLSILDTKFKTLGEKIHHNRIKIVLAEKNVSQTTLSELTGLSKTRISSYCTNSSQPSIETLRMIATALKVNAQRLIVPTPDEDEK